MSVVSDAGKFPSGSLRETRSTLDTLFARYHHRRFVEPDPLQFLYAYEDVRDREIVGLIASCLAFGNVKQIIASIARVLAIVESPRAFVDSTNRATLRKRLQSFRHRFVSGDDLAELLVAVKNVLACYGTLETCFAATGPQQDETVQSSLIVFVDEMRNCGVGRNNFLLPDPTRGSACKRLHLYLRWMVRNDEVDPGGWTGIQPSMLVVPLDTHMHKAALALDLTRRRQANLKTALEITQSLRRIRPEDPVRYDFSLTRPGIRNEPWC